MQQRRRSGRLLLVAACAATAILSSGATVATTSAWGSGAPAPLASSTSQSPSLLDRCTTEHPCSGSVGNAPTTTPTWTGSTGTGGTTLSAREREHAAAQAHLTASMDAWLDRLLAGTPSEATA